MIKNKIMLVLFVLIANIPLFAENTTTFYHQIQSISKESGKIKLIDGSEFKIRDFTWENVLENWEEMDRITVTSRMSGYYYIITNVENNTLAHTFLKQFPTKNDTILCITSCEQEEDNVSKLYLNNGFVFAGPDAATFERWGEPNGNPYMTKSWETDDIVWILHSEEGDHYDIWNLSNHKTAKNSRLVEQK